MSFFIRATNPDLLPNIAGAPSVQIDPHICKFKACCVKNAFTNYNTSIAFVDFKRGSQNRNSSFTPPSFTYRTNTSNCLQLAMSVDSWILNLTGVATRSVTICCSIYWLISSIRDRMVSLDKGTCCSFFSASLPNIMFTTSIAQGFSSVSAITWGFFSLAHK